MKWCPFRLFAFGGGGGGCGWGGHFSQAMNSLLMFLSLFSHSKHNECTLNATARPPSCESCRVRCRGNAIGIVITPWQMCAVLICWLCFCKRLLCESPFGRDINAPAVKAPHPSFVWVKACVVVVVVVPEIFFFLRLFCFVLQCGGTGEGSAHKGEPEVPSTPALTGEMYSCGN